MSQLVGNIILERYRVDAFLGRGGMADVYQVWDLARSTQLAMKVLKSNLAEDEVFITRFRQEAETLRVIQHPNIVRFYGLNASNKLVFMLMEFIDGQTLRQQILKIARPFDSQKVIRIMRPVCAALNYAHHLGFVHCDIKPSNIMLHTNGTVLLADFGISQVAGSASGKVQGIGTPAYMAPEQINSALPAPTMDIYSLGILLYEMLTGGKRPFTGESAHTSGNTTERLRWEQIHLSPPSPRQYHSGISPDLEAIVMRCLEKRPGQRFESILHFQNALEGTLAKQDNPSTVPAEQIEKETHIGMTSVNQASIQTKTSRAQAYWIGVSLLIPILILIAFITASGQSTRNTEIPLQDVPSTIYTSAPRQTAVTVWETYTNADLGISIDRPPSWVYRVQETNPVIVIASSQQALNSQGFVADGAAMALAHSFLEKANFPAYVDLTSPGSILESFMAENFNHPTPLGAAETIQIDNFPATSAIYTTSNTTQDMTVILYGVAVVTPEILVLLIGICSDAEWPTYQPVFNRMRDSLKLQ